jgi:uncharacterized NAD-dependent epimerase/dehydratase family protein
MTRDIKHKTSDGNALVYCEGAFNTTNGKTAHGLVRFTERYHIKGVIDSRYAGQDAGTVLDGQVKNIPIWSRIDDAKHLIHKGSDGIHYLVVGLAPDGGRLPEKARLDIQDAIKMGLNIDCGLHDFLSEDKVMMDLATRYAVNLRDIRKPPLRHQMHFFEGKIEQVDCLKLAVLGTDSAVGKRTTAWILVHGLRALGLKAELIGTGQTAWLQGARYGIVMDSLINDFVSGEIEHAVFSAWHHEKPDVIIIEGQGSLMNPAYPGGFEILAAGRPDGVILQHAPMRIDYDGFPGYRIHPIEKQIAAITILSGKPVVAITLNHEDMAPGEIPAKCQELTHQTGLPVYDVLAQSPGPLVQLIDEIRQKRKK